MHQKLTDYIRKNPGKKARTISKELKLDRSKVSRFLHASDDFFQENYDWHLRTDSEVVLYLPNKWITTTIFEKFLAKTGCLFEDPYKIIKIVFEEKSYIKLDAGIRLLFLINMLILAKKDVILDFKKCEKVSSYLNRAGFFDALDPTISVIPSRPKRSTAKIYKGNSNNLVEFAKIIPDADKYDNAIPNVLTNSFITHTSPNYEGAAYNLFTELCENIVQHSDSPIPGIAAMQVYNNAPKPHVQIVISDAGIGICNTLRPALKLNNTLQENISLDDLSDGELLAIAYTNGGLSRKNIDSDDEGGLGLRTSGLGTKKHNAKLLIRLEKSQFELIYEKGSFLAVREQENLPRLPGTHISFQFAID
jgi:hypothetical protein